MVNPTLTPTGGCSAPRTLPITCGITLGLLVPSNPKLHSLGARTTVAVAILGGPSIPTSWGDRWASLKRRSAQLPTHDLGFARGSQIPLACVWLFCPRTSVLLGAKCRQTAQGNPPLCPLLRIKEGVRSTKGNEVSFESIRFKWEHSSGMDNVVWIWCGVSLRFTLLQILHNSHQDIVCPIYAACAA